MLKLDEYERYGRQMILPQIGLEGQEKLKSAKILVVGAGGLGSPAIEYLAGLGIGVLGIVDNDYVEISNVHRQVIHSEPGISKCESAKRFVNKLNKEVTVKTFETQLNSLNAIEIISQFDIVLGCTDGITSRYVINDACVILNKPLVSGAALGIDGQLAVYNYRGGPCYRCLFPNPPPQELAPACSDVGVLGPVVGVIGVMQAAEAVKIILEWEPQPPFLLVFCLTSFPMFKQVRIRPKQANCLVCAHPPAELKLNNDWYKAESEEFCELPLENVESISVKNLGNNLSEYTLLDIRSPTQYGICSIPESINVPFNDLKKYLNTNDTSYLVSKLPAENTNKKLAVICRRGVDSTKIVQWLHNSGVPAYNVTGGIVRWAKEHDNEFPIY